MEPRDATRAKLAEVKARKFLASPQGATIILGDSHARRWPEDLPVPGQKGPIVNLGIGGDRIEDIHWRVATWPLSMKAPTSILLFAGSNNVVAGETSNTILKRIGSLVQLISGQTSCRLFVIGLLPRGRNYWFRPVCISEINQGIQNMADTSNFNTVFPNAVLSSPGFKDGLSMYFSDYAHLNQNGYNVIVRLLECIAT